MSDKIKISQLPLKGEFDGSERLPLAHDGVSYGATKGLAKARQWRSEWDGEESAPNIVNIFTRSDKFYDKCEDNIYRIE